MFTAIFFVVALGLSLSLFASYVAMRRGLRIPLGLRELAPALQRPRRRHRNSDVRGED